MKAKKYRIRIQSLGDTLTDFESAFGAAQKRTKGLDSRRGGELVLGFESFEILSKIITPERLRLLKTIRSERPTSVSQLARYLKRAQANVYKDVQFLAQLGIVTLKTHRTKAQKGRASQQPCFDFDGFDIAV